LFFGVILVDARLPNQPALLLRFLRVAFGP